MVHGLAVEEVRDEDAVLVGAVVGVGEDVGALDALRGEAEDVEDDEDGGGGGGGAGGVCFGEVYWVSGWRVGGDGKGVVARAEKGW